MLQQHRNITRLGYTYLSLKDVSWDIKTNIFREIFIESIAHINNIDRDEASRVLADISLLLENNDLGKSFYERLVDRSGIKLIDFENFDNNTFNVVTELTYKNGEDEFRPDIILLVNGMPLVFIEVKKPNNPERVLAEKERINRRFSNKKFRRFVNMTQMMIFSNNMEYDDNSALPIQGAFYATASYSKPSFNYFREEELFDLETLLHLENFVLKDTNLLMIKHSPEFLTNKDPNTPTNRIATSLLSRECLAFMLQYGITYVKKDKEALQKHIMRYPQLFGTKAIERKLDEGVRKGIIWHTQGSGKTALAFYNVKHLTDYFQKKSVKIDFLFVYNMLLTGFDAPRLKKLYVGRVIREHNLLQALTRVNRTYKDFKYGYVVDFADISKEFEATNEAYFKELSEELGDEMEHYSQLFKSKEEIVEELEEIKEVIWEFDTLNHEIFSQQISKISDIKEMQGIKKALANAKSLYNLIRLFEYDELLEKLDFKRLNQLYTEANNHLKLLNLKKKSEEQSDNSTLINEALEDIVFLFRKIGQEELLLADRLKDTLRKAREGLVNNFDKKDPEYVKLKEELERLFRKNKLQKVSQEELSKNIMVLNKILEKVRELNQKNERISQNYKEDKKYMRLHKRLTERNLLSSKASKLFEALQGIKNLTDDEFVKNSKLLDNENYFEKNMLKLIFQELKHRQKIQNLDAKSAKYINNLVVKEYINEYNNVFEW